MGFRCAGRTATSQVPFWETEGCRSERSEKREVHSEEKVVREQRQVTFSKVSLCEVSVLIFSKEKLEDSGYLF